MRHLPIISLVVMVLVAISWQLALNRSYDQGKKAAANQRRAVFRVEPVPAPPEPPRPPQVASASEEAQERLGPFSLAGNDYVVVLQQKPRAPGTTQETGKTVVSLEIRDSHGAVLYKRAFRSQAEKETYSDAWYVTAHLMPRGGGTGLMLNYSVDRKPPAPTPEETTWWQLFGVVDGMLRPFTAPLAVQGDLLDSHVETFDFKVWAHHASLIFPARVDWAKGKLLPDQNCEITPCQFRAIAKDPGDRRDLTFVHLCPNPEKCGSPQGFVVKKDSDVEVLACYAPVRWKEGNVSGPSGQDSGVIPGAGEISVPKDAVWLKMRIDGKEGWVQDEKDFMSLGMIYEQ
jgi:hypothetical protein